MKFLLLELKNPFRNKRKHVLRSFIPGRQKKTARPRMFRHFVPSRELHSLVTLKRLSPVDLPSANGFDKLFAASKFVDDKLEVLRAFNM